MRTDNVARRAVFERYLTEAEERQLFRHIAGCSGLLAARDLAWMRLLRQTGMRVGTLAGFTCADAQQAQTSETLVVRPEIAKRGMGYAVHINKDGRAAIKQLLRIRRDMGFSQHPDEPLVMSLRGRGLSVRSYQARMHEWVADSGIAVAASPHWFRHTLAKRVVARSVATDPIGIVQAVLGQRTRNSAAVYALPDRNDVRDALEAAR